VTAAKIRPRGGGGGGWLEPPLLPTERSQALPTHSQAVMYVCLAQRHTTLARRCLAMPNNVRDTAAAAAAVAAAWAVYDEQ